MLPAVMKIRKGIEARYKPVIGPDSDETSASVPHAVTVLESWAGADGNPASKLKAFGVRCQGLGFLVEQSRIQKLCWIQKLGFRNSLRGIQKLSRQIQKLFRRIQKLLRWIQKLCLQKLYRWIQNLSSWDSETLFVGFRN